MSSEKLNITKSHANSAAPSQSQQVPFGASAVTFLLSDHKAFGFSERACYHFDLMETLIQSPVSKQGQDEKKEYTKKPIISVHELSDNINDSSIRDASNKEGENHNNNLLDVTPNNNHNQNQIPDSVSSCGVVALLECINAAPIKQSKKRKRLIKKIKDFNKNADEQRRKYKIEGKSYCHQPLELPLHLNMNTRVAFAYEVTRIVFCIDASPTLTATFGNLGSVQQAVSADGAVCAIDRLENMTRLFFRSLVQPIKGVSKFYEKQNDGNNLGWSPQLAVTVVACYPPSILPSDDEETFSLLVSDYRFDSVDGADFLCDRIAAWVAMEVESSIAAKFGRTGGRQDSTSSSLQYIIETCEACDNATLPSKARPCFVIATDCRAVDCDSVMDIVRNDKLKDVPLHVLDLSGSKTHRSKYDATLHEQSFYLTYDHDGPSSFPLSIADDAEALFDICRATRGNFFDTEILKGACEAIAGEGTADSPFNDDIYFSAKRRTVRPNGVQWYIIFSLSPCCPLQIRWGNTPSPNYIQQKREMQKQPYKAMLFSYQLSPVRVRSILIMRIMDGFRTKKYGSNSQDADKVSIQFYLNIELGMTIQYELSFVSSRFHNAMLGSAFVKVSLLGESAFIQMVKRKYILNELNRHPQKSSAIAKDVVSNKICSFLKNIRDEDALETKITMDDKLPDSSAFLTSIRNLTEKQLYRHFRRESFELCCISVSKVDVDVNSTDRLLIDLISSWSSKTITHRKLYLRQLATTGIGLTDYCLVEINRSEQSFMLYKIHLHFFEQVDSQIRIAYCESLRSAIAKHDDSLFITPRLCSHFLFQKHHDYEERSTSRIHNLFQFKQWELLKDPELITLITKRRCQFDHFHPVIMNSTCTLLIKFLTDESNNIFMVQYCLCQEERNVIVNLFMDSQKGDFSKAFSRFIRSNSEKTTFLEIYDDLRERDQQCSQALRSWRTLLNLFTNNHQKHSFYDGDIQRLLQHAQKTSVVLRFFNEKTDQDGLPTLANQILEKLTSQFILSGSLNVDVIELLIGNPDNLGIHGKWFLFRLSADRLSLLYFPSYEQNEDLDVDEGSYMVRELSIFLITTTNLYLDPKTENSKDNKDYSVDAGNCVIIKTICEDIKNAHGRNYSLASFLALRNRTASSKDSEYTSLDFQFALSYCAQHQITNDVEIKSNIDTGDEGDDDSFESKLLTFIGGVLKPVPGGSPYFYFDAKISESYEIIFQNDEASSDPSEKEKHSFDENNHVYSDPLYVTFTLDGKSASLSQLHNFSLLPNQSSILNAFITTFKDSKIDFGRFANSQTETLGLHDLVAHHLVTRLNSFVAEQTLERLRKEHENRGNIEYDTVRKCLREAANVVIETIGVHFYFSKTDTMLDASTSIGMEGDFRQKFSLLCSCISHQDILLLHEIADGEFIASDVENLGWCLVSVPENFGCISVHVFNHRNDVAKEISTRVLRAISYSCHRTNQILLLEQMHKTRTASSLIIPENKIDGDADAAFNDLNQQRNILEYPTGYFECDVSFQTSYPLNKRCKLSSVIIDLEASVLHSFAITNRPGKFVYKDEDDNVFYMELQSQPAVEGGPDKVVLVVYGTILPGPSITIQLNRLLQKKTMLICTESISRVLTKNRHYHLEKSDIQFIQRFEQDWKNLEVDKQLEDEERDSIAEEIYAFPAEVYDPVLVLVFFRQNISGSLFFTSAINNESIEEVSTEIDETAIDRNGVPFTFSHKEFNLCYNASQFQAAKFQTSTITEVGKHYARQAGTGVALIEIKLLDSSYKPFESFTVGIKTDNEILPSKMNHLRFEKLRGNADSQSRCHLSVRIVNTTLKTSILHKWIELTLNQALSSWITEMHLQRSLRLRGCFSPDSLIGFSKLIHEANDLPHPAAKRIDFDGHVKSTDLSVLVFHFLERLLSSLFDGKKYQPNDIQGIQTVRFCGKEDPKLVKLFALPSHKLVRTFDLTNKQMISDTPALNLQYVSSFGLSVDDENNTREKKKTTVPVTSYLFQKVHLFKDNVKNGTLSDALIKLMNRNPNDFFIRRIAFLIVVTRTKTTILLYNWNPKLYESLLPRLQDKFNEMNTMKEPLSLSKATGTVEPVLPKSSSSKSILMPTIVGKSMKGSAIQAVQRARARATATMPSGMIKTNKPSIGSNAPPKDMKRSTWNAREKKNSSKKETSEVLKHLPASLAKEYLAIFAKLSMEESNTTFVHALQLTLINWLDKFRGKEIPLKAIEFILPHTNYCYVQTFPLIQSVVNDPYPFLKYLSNQLMSQFTNTSIRTMNFALRNSQQPNTSVLNPTIYIMRTINLYEQKSIIFFYEVNMTSHASLGRIGKVKCWSLMEHAGNNITNIETELAILNLRRELFHFSSSILRNVLKHKAYNIISDLDISLLLRETKALFPARVQRWTNKVGQWFRLFYRTIVWDASIDITMDQFIHYVIANSDEYGIFDLSKSSKCFGGQVYGDDVEDVYFYIIPQKNEVDAFDLSVITFTHGRDLDNMKGPIRGVSLSNYIIDMAKSTLLEIIERASIDYVRDQIWVEQSDWV